MQLALNIIRKDWTEHRRAVFMFAAAGFIPVIVAGPSPQFAKGTMLGVLIGITYGYAEICFFDERRRGTLQLLLNLPVHPFDLAIAKYAAMYSMLLVSVNIPLIFMLDLRLMLAVNALAVSLATLSMAGAVLSDKSWVVQIPMWVAILIVLPPPEVLRQYFPVVIDLIHWSLQHSAPLSIAALLTSSLLAIFSCWIFSLQNRAR